MEQAMYPFGYIKFSNCSTYWNLSNNKYRITLRNESCISRVRLLAVSKTQKQLAFYLVDTFCLKPQYSTTLVTSLVE